MLRKEMNKKGQEMSITTLLLIVLGVVVVVVVILAVSGVFGPIFEKLKFVPSGLGTLVKACEGYAQIDSKIDFCTFREVTIDSKKEYVNCEDDRVERGMDPTLTGKVSCGTAEQIEKDIKVKCASLIVSGVKNPVVNEKSCSQYIFTCAGDLSSGSGLGGVLHKTTESCPPAKSKKITEGFSEAPNNICCVTP